MSVDKSSKLPFPCFCGPFCEHKGTFSPKHDLLIWLIFAPCRCVYAFRFDDRSPVAVLGAEGSCVSKLFQHVPRSTDKLQKLEIQMGRLRMFFHRWCWESTVLGLVFPAFWEAAMNQLFKGCLFFLVGSAQRFYCQAWWFGTLVAPEGAWPRHLISFKNMEQKWWELDGIQYYVRESYIEIWWAAFAFILLARQGLSCVFVVCKSWIPASKDSDTKSVLAKKPISVLLMQLFWMVLFWVTRLKPFGSTKHQWNGAERSTRKSGGSCDFFSSLHQILWGEMQPDGLHPAWFFSSNLRSRIYPEPSLQGSRVHLMISAMQNKPSHEFI